MRAAFIGSLRLSRTRRDRVGNAGEASKSRARENLTRLLPPLEELLQLESEPTTEALSLTGEVPTEPLARVPAGAHLHVVRDFRVRTPESDLREDR